MKTLHRDKTLCKIASSTILLMLLCVFQVSADTRGKLSGQILDERKAPIIGSNVLLIGTSLGGATDPDGFYAIINIPPGLYDVRFSAVGYGEKIVKQIRISSGQTTTINETLAEEAVQAQEVVVIAERPLVDTRQTSAVTILGEDQISVLPVQELQDIVNLQAGVVDGHFRGGRIGEVQYQVDGVSVNNPYDNSSTVRLDRSVLQEVQVISGTFDAEYGQAMSGVVNAVLRSGRPDLYEWSIEIYGGDYVAPSSDIRRPNPGRSVPFALYSFQGSVSGPLPVLPKSTFLFSVRRYIDEGYLYGERRFLPTDKSDFERKIYRPTGDNKIVPMAPFEEWSGQAKISNASFENIQLSYQAIWNASSRKPYSYLYRLDPDGQRTQTTRSLVHGFDLTQMLSEKYFYTLSVRHNYFDYNDYRYEDVFDPAYLLAGDPKTDANYEQGAVIQGVDLGRFTQITNSLVTKATITGQVTNVHLLKAGVELQLSTLTFGQPGVLTATTVGTLQILQPRENDPDPKYGRVKEFYPVSFAAFLQDRIEWNDVMVRAGARLEYFDAKTKIPSDLQNPANSIRGVPASNPKETKKKTVIAPRLGISYPIIVNGSIYFSYGHFYQLPGLGQFFDNSDYTILKELQAGAISYGVLGNPDLRPEFTTQYEFGMKVQLSESFGIDASLFYKDIRDLLGVEFVSTYTAADYARLTNVDFGSATGFTLALDHRSMGFLTSSVDYTYQLALGNSSDPKETATRAEAGEDPRPRVVPLAWDQRHTINTTIGIQQSGNYAVTTIVKFASGQPYTPSIGSGFGAELESNSGRKTTAVMVDLRGEKNFTIGGIEFVGFIRINNLFNAFFFNGFVFSSTGSADYSLFPIIDQNPLKDPNRYVAPRRIEIGISLQGSSDAQ